MPESPLPRPEHLEEVTSRGGLPWLAKRPAGAAALVLGIVSFVVVALVQEPLWTTPDWRLSVPGFVATLVAAFVSIRRRERAHVLWLAGIGIAGAALVLGWFLMLAIVLGVVAILMVILNSVM